MSWNQFIYSSKIKYKFSRHILFWVIYLLHEASCYIPLKNASEVNSLTGYSRALLIAICYLPVNLFSVYTFLYVLLPLVLLRKYYQFIGLLPLVLVVNILLAIISTNLFANIHETDLSIVMRSQDIISTSLVRAVGYSYVATTLAITIKLLKELVKQQNNINRIERNKIKLELSLLKSQLYPEIILNCFDMLGNKISGQTEDSAEAILKLSELISYILYETDEDTVLLDHELTAIRNLIDYNELENNSFLTTHIEINHQLPEQPIYPLLLFTVFQFLYFLPKNVTHFENKKLLIVEINNSPEKMTCIYSSALLTDNGSGEEIQNKITHFLDSKAKEISHNDFSYTIFRKEQGLEIILELNHLKKAV